MQQMVEPVAVCVRDSIEYFVLRGDEENYEGMVGILKEGLEKLEKLLNLELFVYPLEQDKKYSRTHVTHLLKLRLS